MYTNALRASGEVVVLFSPPFSPSAVTHAKAKPFLPGGDNGSEAVVVVVEVFFRMHANQ